MFLCQFNFNFNIQPRLFNSLFFVHIFFQNFNFRERTVFACSLCRTFSVLNSRNHQESGILRVRVHVAFYSNNNNSTKSVCLHLARTFIWLSPSLETTATSPPVPQSPVVVSVGIIMCDAIHKFRFSKTLLFLKKQN